MTTDPPRRSYRPIVLGALAGLLVATFAAVLIVLINRTDPPPPVAGPEGCATTRNQVRLEFDGPTADADMQAAADHLRGDKQVATMRTETRPQAYEHYKEAFKDQPDLLAIARPDALPATIWLVTRDATPSDLATRLRPTVPPATKINPDPCAYPI